LKTSFYKVISTVASIMLLILLIFGTIHYFGLNKGIYGFLQRQLKVNDEIGITQADLDEVTDVFIDYTKDRIDSIDVAVTLDNEKTEMFNTREKLHMIDVKNLYISMIYICYFFLAFIIVVFSYLFIKKKKSVIFEMHKKVSVGFLFFCVALIAYFIIDFNSFWTNVHLLLFTNDLWLLNPMTDRMIIMFPLNFFMSLSSIVLFIFVAIFVPLFVIANKYSKIKEDRN